VGGGCGPATASEPGGAGAVTGEGLCVRCAIPMGWDPERSVPGGELTRIDQPRKRLTMAGQVLFKAAGRPRGTLAPALCPTGQRRAAGHLLGHHLRGEAASTITRDVDLDRSDIGQYPLAGRTVAGVSRTRPGLVTLLVAEVIAHLGLQRVEPFREVFWLRRFQIGDRERGHLERSDYPGHRPLRGRHGAGAGGRVSSAGERASAPGCRTLWRPRRLRPRRCWAGLWSPRGSRGARRPRTCSRAGRG
jgi:hypothetical protein